MPQLTSHAVRHAVTNLAVASLAVGSLAACGDSISTINEPSGLRASFNTAPISADMQISGSSSTGSPNGGAAFTYTFQVKWSGGGEADNNVFVDTLPAGVGFNYAAVTGITGTAGACTEDAMVVTCKLPNFDKSTGYTLSVIVNVNAPPTVGTFSNTGIITSTTPDPQPANNRVTVTAQVKTPLAACVLPADQTTLTSGAVMYGVLDAFSAYEQFAYFANGQYYWVVTNYFDGTQPLSTVINLDCKTSPAQFVQVANFITVTGVLDGTMISLNGVTMPVLRASVIQVFTHKDAI
jgi:uncharacterized repeat protein (TIGR01451 family)